MCVLLTVTVDCRAVRHARMHTRAHFSHSTVGRTCGQACMMNSRQRRPEQTITDTQKCRRVRKTCWRMHLVTMGSEKYGSFYDSELVRKALLRRVPLTYTIDPDETPYFAPKEVGSERTRTSSFLSIPGDLLPLYILLDKNK